MLNASIGNEILDGLFGLLGKKKIKFDGDLYLGLLTKLPNDNGDPYEDGKYFAEPTDPSYLRIKINTISRINKMNFIGNAQSDEVVNIGEDKAIPAYVTNQSLIMFPEASEEWGRIVGFGLFRSGDTTSQNLPILWGAVTTEGGEEGEEGVSIGQHEVPIIRIGGFKVSLV